jgi:hypothetical protein
MESSFLAKFAGQNACPGSLISDNPHAFCIALVSVLAST